MSRSTPPLRRVRWLLLTLVFVVLAAIVVLYWFGRAGSQGRPRPASEGEVTAGEGIVTLGEGFEYTHYEEGREAFSIRAARTLEDRQSQVFLEGVGMVVTDAEGQRWEMRADKATYNRDTQGALLEGSVHLEGGEGLALRTESLQLGEEGSMVTSTGAPVEILWKGRYRGRGDRMRVHFPSGLFLLAGNVKVTSEPEVVPPLTLTGERVFLERTKQQIRSDGGVRMAWGDDLLNGDELQIHLDPTLALVRFVRIRGNVAARRVELSGGGAEEAGPPRRAVTEVRSKGVVAVMQPDGQEIDELQVEGSPQNPALLVHRPPGQEAHSLRAGYMTSKQEPGGGRRVVAYGGVLIVQPQAAKPGSDGPQESRRLTSDRARAEMDAAGTLRRVWAEGGVDFRDGQVEAVGRRMTWDAVAGTAELFATDSGAGGADAPDVRVVSDRGRLEAPVVRYSQGSNLLEAEGGVEAVLTDTGRLASGPLGGGGGSGAAAQVPIRVEAREGQFRDQPQGFLFRGDVKAWQGDRFVFAEWLRGEQTEGRLTAGGGVRTVWTGAAPGAAGSGAAETLEVEAQELTYAEAENRVVYQGDVVSEQEQRTLACDRLEVTLAEGGDAERLDCSGRVRLTDRQHGQQAQAARAVYRPGARTVELTGEPAVVTRDDGGRVAAPQLDYDIDAGRVRGRAASGTTNETRDR